MLIADALLWIAIVSLAASALAAIGSRVLRDFSRHDLQEICEQRQHLDRFGDIVRHHEETALGVEIFIGMATVLFAVAGGLYAWERIVADPISWLELLEIVAVLALLRTVVAGCLPWAVVQVGAERFLYFSWPCWRFLSWLNFPLIAWRA